MNELEKAREEINRADEQIVRAFVQRMVAAEKIGAYKRKNGLPVLDPAREAAVLERNSRLVEDDALRPYYRRLLKTMMSLSREYQHSLAESARKDAFPLRFPVTDSQEGPDILLGRGLLESAGQYLNLRRKVLLVTDSGVPESYRRTVSSFCETVVPVILPPGEESKCLENWSRLLSLMAENAFSRSDCVVSLGGGMVSDLSGFAASCYMRGIDFCSIPTTLLAQIDASVGGKTAVNFSGAKNTVGSFCLPKRVLIDPNLLSTLPERQLSAGMAEAVKMGLIADPDLFELFESGEYSDRMDEIILRSLKVKLRLVREDFRDTGSRRLLNFGHTFGHAIEAAEEGKLLHGECVALGMLPMCSPEVRTRLRPVLERLHLSTVYAGEEEKILSLLRMDKKLDGDSISAVFCPSVGCAELRKLTPQELVSIWKESL